MADVGQFENTTLDHVCHEAQIRADKVPNGCPVSAEMELSHFRYNVEVEPNWSARGSMPRGPCLVWLKLLTSEDLKMQIA